jgi:hypothetical protein
VKHWRIFGRMPSNHDVDAVLVANSDVYERLTQKYQPLCESLYTYETSLSREVAVAPERLHLPDGAVDEAVELGSDYGLPLDLFLVPCDGDFSLAAWVEPGGREWALSWRVTLDNSFFDTAFG